MPEPAVNPNKALWEKGDFTRIAASMRESGQSFVASLGDVTALSVLDLACGDGNTAIPLGQAGANVRGIDIASNLVAAGNTRAQDLHLSNVRFEEGDASHLDNVKDNSFDLLVSVFGAMFAPRPFDVAKEMYRVVKPGGRIVMANWIAGDPTLVAQILKISASYLPPPPEGFVSPVTWGMEAHVQERFGKAGAAADRITCARETWMFTLRDKPPLDLLQAFWDFYGPTMNAVAAADAAGRKADLRQELEHLFVSQNAATDGSTHIPAVYLRVTVRT